MNNQSLREAAQQALEALKQLLVTPLALVEREFVSRHVFLLRDALAQPDDKAQPVAVDTVTDAMVDAYLKAQRETVEEADRCFGRPNIGGLHTNTVREACRSGLSAAVKAAQQPPAEQPFKPDWMSYKQGLADGKAEAEHGAELSDYPPLPKPDCPNIWGGAHSEKQMRAYVDSDRAVRAYKDSTPELHIGDSAFESWFANYNPANKGDKQRARDAYAAGMGDPLVTYAAPQPLYADPFSYIVQHLNSNPYSLSKNECIALIGELRDSYYATPQPQAQKVCKCSLRTRLVGDGCAVCNPELAKELAEQGAELCDEQIDTIKDSVDWSTGWAYLEFARAAIAADRAARVGAA